MSSKINPIPPLTEEEINRFWAMVDQRTPDECWPWLGAKAQIRPTKTAYGVWWRTVNGRPLMQRPHRVSYTLKVGPIPDGLTLDHVKPRCVIGGLCCNPSHTEPVTRGVNAKRHYLAQTHCKRGHEITQHGRACPECKLTQDRERIRAKRAAKRKRDALKETA